MRRTSKTATVIIAIAAVVFAGATPSIASASSHRPGPSRLHAHATQRPVPGAHASAIREPIAKRYLYHSATRSPLAALSTTVTPAADGSWQAVGTDGISLAHAAGAPSGVKVDVLSAAAIARLGLSGVVLRVTRADANTSPSSVAVSIPANLLNAVAGVGFAARARLMTLSGCGPQVCRSTAILATRHVASTETGAPTAPATALSTAPAPRTGTGAVVATVPVSASPMLVTATAAANASDGSGDSSATSLAPSSQWTASPQTGDFTWSYPLRTPPAAAGPAPSLTISYDSASINGQTGATNNQPSWVGEGFDLSGAGGYIERSYVPCSQAGISGSGDLCFKTDNATLSLAGHSSTMVESSSGTWRLADDDNTKVEHLTSNTTLCSNGTYDNDCWRLTTSDGTQYYFGRNELPNWVTGDAQTASAWTVAVCGTATTKCTGSSPSAETPINTQAWRWNLDYVVDIHGNSEAFYYARESNRYAEKASTTSGIAYYRGGYLKRIDYGMHAGSELTAQAPDQVIFTPGPRCETGVSGEPSSACSTIPPASTNDQYWPDVPFNDDYCSTTACAGKISPTFWSTQRLASVQTQYLSGSSYVPVDTWTLAPEWQATGDGTPSPLQLYSITHTGDVGTPSLSLPPTVFGYAMKPNRVAPPNGIVPLEKPRLIGITTEAGAQITINYLDTDCSGSSPATPQSNTKRCFPQYWSASGTPTLDWFRTYLVSSVIANPETGGSLDYPDQTFYDYSVGTPAYRLDTSPLTKDGYRTWSVFAGYNKVRVENGDPNTPATLQTTVYTYFRGMDGDIADTTGAKRPPQTLTASDGTQVTDSLWWAGQTFETQIYNGLSATTPTSDIVTTPWASATATNTGVAQTEKIGTSSTSFTYTPTAHHTGVASTVTYGPLSTGGQRTTKTDNTFDSYGRITKAEDLGDTSDANQAQCTVTTYADNATLNLLDLPKEVDTYAGTCANPPTDMSTANINDARISYDNLAWGATPTVGDTTLEQRASAYTSGAVSGWTTTMTNAYDALGRLTSSKDALNRVTGTSYTPTAPAAGVTFTGDIDPLIQVKTTDPMSFTRTDVINPAWGATTKSTDVNGNVTTSVYDQLGRITQRWDPARPQAQNPTPTISYAYTETPGQPVAVATTTLSPSGGTQTSYVLYDGLLRRRQTQSPAEATSYNAPAGSGGSSVTETLYDFAGQPVEGYGPYAITASPSTTRYDPQNYANIASSTSTVYDGVGRVTDSITNAYGIEQWDTKTAYPGVDRVDVTPPDGGTPTTTYTDGRGRTTSLLQWKNGVIGDTTATTTYDKTSYTYYPTGQQHTLTNQASQQWSWTYDVLGRVASASDPDTGTTYYTYDADNEVQSTKDANLTTLWYSYDLDGRKTAVQQNSSSGALLDAWTYDTLPAALGLLASSTSYVGATKPDGRDGTPYTEAVTGYDADGRPRGTTITLPAGTLGTGSAAYTYTTGVTYNPDGSIATQTEPSAGDLPAETLNYTYTSLGRLYSLAGAKQYLFSTGYDPATGLITELSRYNGTYELNDVYSYTPGTLRLSDAQAQTTTGLAADVSYTYKNNGDITEISNAPTGAPVDTQCFSYDYVERLIAAWTPSSSGCPAATNGNLGGPAPYWTTYSYDASGDRTAVIQHATTTTGTDTGQQYYYLDTNHAHGLTTVKDFSSPASQNTWTQTGADQYAYTADGQTKTAPGQTLAWTPQGQLQSVTVNGQTQQRVYDADGNLLVQTDPANGTTAYLGDTELRVAPGTITQTGQRTYSASGHAIAVRAGTTVTWLDTDPHGTNEVAEGYTTGTVTSRYFDPNGNPRGSVPSAWPNDRGFLNAPADTFSSYTTLGAREYDPSLGRFLSVDPVLETNDPQAINGYSYADNNPVNKTDASGLRPLGDDGSDTSAGCWGGTHCTPSHLKAPGLAYEHEQEAAASVDEVWISPHVRMRASAQASALNAAFTKYTQGRFDLYETNARSPYQGSLTEAFAWALFCNGAGASLCGIEITQAWDEITSSLERAPYEAQIEGDAPIGSGAEVVNDFGISTFQVNADVPAEDMVSAALPDISEPYSRPSNATTRAQRASVQGQPCVDCGDITSRQVADHVTPLVVEYYTTGQIDTTKMRSIGAVQAQCPICSARQGGRLSQYSRQMRIFFGLDR